jgi:hypothetical protein
MIAALTLAVALALPQGAETVRISADLWPERQKVERLEPGERVWWWSAECAPQLLSAQEPDVACAPQKTQRVHVLDRATGKGVAGARVIWATDAMLVHLPDALLPFATTDAAGNAELRVPLDDALRVRVDGPRTASWWQTAANGTARIATVPAAGAVVQVTPASRAVVELELPASDIRSRAVARDGRVILPVLPPVPMTMAAWSDTGAPLVLEVDGARMPGQVELPRGASIEGRVVDAKRRPIEGASIETVFAIGKLARGLRRSVRSTSRGVFVMSGVPLGPIRLQVSKPDLATIVRGLQAEERVDLGNITLHPSRKATVLVMDAEERPVERATVRVADGTSATTGRDGMARVDAIAAGEDVSIHITARGFRPAEETLTGDAKILRVVLSRGVRVTGRVVDATTGEAAGAGDVLLIHNGGRRIVPFENGAIDLGGLDSGTLSLEVRARDFAPVRIAERTLADDESWDFGTLPLSAGDVIAGRVLDDSAAPLAGARIRTLRANDPVNPELAAVMNDWIETRSGDDGSFRIAGVTEGEPQVLFDAPGFAPRMIPMATNAEPVDVRLDRPRGLVIECSPVARCNAEARLLYAGAMHPWAVTSAEIRNGTARIAAAAPGEALLRLVRDGHVLHERTVRVGTTPETRVQIQLLPAALHGLVTTAGRARRDGGIVDLRAKLSPAAGMPVFLERRTEDGLVVGGNWAGDIPLMQTTTVNESGVFVFDDLEPGTYEVTYRLDGRVARSQTIDIAAGLSRITIDVPPGALHGRVLQQDGHAARFAAVQIVDSTGTSVRALCDQLGRFDAIGVAHGRALVTAETPLGTASLEIDVRETNSRSLELVLQPRAVTDR